MNNLFKEKYYSDSNILSNNELWKEIKKDDQFNSNIKRSDFDNWLSKQEQEQIKTVKYKPSLYHPILAKEFSYAVDLMFFKDLYSLNNGNDCIVNYIEITTRKAYSYPLKSKSKSDVYNTFQTFYNEIGGKIKILEMDKGTEFNDVIKFCKKNDIEVIIYTNDKNSMSPVERFNRTLRSYLDKKMKKGRWIDILDIIVKAYNNKTHSATGYSPNFLSTHTEKQNEYRDSQFSKAILPRMETNKFSIGDKVRIYKKKSIFGKGKGQFSKTIHTITDIHKNSIFVDDKPDKYRYYNILKIGEVEATPELDEEIIKARKNYKRALTLAKEQTIRKSVKELDGDLQNLLNDDTKGKGKRIKKPNSKYL